MADLFLHLPFARRLRFAEGLHPIAGEAIGRRPSLVILGATLAALPGRERQGMSWFRRLFSGGGEAARWQKLLAPSPGQPHVNLVVSILRSEEAAIGPMARFALGAGLLAHELLEEKVGAVTSSLAGPQRAAVERAQARLWLQMLEKDLKAGGRLDHEWRPVLDLADTDAHKRTLQQVDRALKRVHGSGPGDGALARWLKALAAEVGPLAEGKGPLPPSLSIADSDARAAHFDQVGFLDKVRAAQSSFVIFANRIAETFQKGSAEAAGLTEALGSKLEDPVTDPKASSGRWKIWLDDARDQAMTRGRNPKPAYAEGEEGAALPEQRLANITKVMTLADLPPEADPTGAPPVPDGSGPVTAPAPNVTQEVSSTQIEAESKAFASPPLTQEVSMAQIVDADAFSAPAHTQEVSSAQLMDVTADAQPISAEGEAISSIPPIDTSVGVPGAPTNVTQPISAADVVAANEEDEAAKAVPPTAPLTDPPVSANGANGVAEHTPTAEPLPPVDPVARPEEPPRE